MSRINQTHYIIIKKYKLQKKHENLVSPTTDSPTVTLFQLRNRYSPTNKSSFFNY